jgi:hypothetical protein
VQARPKKGHFMTEKFFIRLTHGTCSFVSTV